MATYRDSHLNIDLDRRTVAVDSRQLTLTRKEFELLSFLVAHAGEIVPREALLTSVWGYSAGVRTRTLDMHLSLLRKKLRPYSDHYIERIFRIGCRFQPCYARPQLMPATNVA
jgi:DNA-binding response OmpR family regulator